MHEQSINVSIGKIADALEAVIAAGQEHLAITVDQIYASDLMSDVLAYGETGSCLLTGLNTVQAAISSYMAEFKAIVILRGKVPAPEICKFAKEREIAVLSTKLDMYEACIQIARIDGRLLPACVPSEADKVDNTTIHEFVIDGQDFASAGLVSTGIKQILKKIGYDMPLIRRIAISIYEAEMNVVMHARKADVTLTASDHEITVVLDDEGKGIPDIKKAMTKGFSTATEEQRAMGFGAGMGLPNIDKNSDNLDVTSEVGKGTKLVMTFLVK
ncbi:MAG: hypothetical protein GY757_25960 [bacterium]|nr:hypothetical protein [bacterium]